MAGAATYAAYQVTVSRTTPFRAVLATSIPINYYGT